MVFLGPRLVSRAKEKETKNLQDRVDTRNQMVSKY
jgi:hypothetical protein